MPAAARTGARAVARPGAATGGAELLPAPGRAGAGPRHREPSRGLPHPRRPARGRRYLDASWTREGLPVIPLDALRAGGVVGVDTNTDHLAAWPVDGHGNPIGAPRRFDHDLSGSAEHRDARLRHALTRLRHRAKATGVRATAIGDLDSTDSEPREKHGRKKKFRQLVSGIPASRLRARLLSTCAEPGISVIAVDPARTSTWGAEHWQKPHTAKRRPATRRHAAAVASGRRSLGHRTRRRTAPPRRHQCDAGGRRTARARRPQERGKPRPACPVHDCKARGPDAAGTRWTRTPKIVRGVRLSTCNSCPVPRNG